MVSGPAEKVPVGVGPPIAPTPKARGEGVSAWRRTEGTSPLAIRGPVRPAAPSPARARLREPL